MQPQDYLDRLSTHLKNTIARAIGTATAMAHTEVTPLHLVFSLTEEQGAIGSEILSKLGITRDAMQDLLAKQETIAKPSSDAPITTTLPELSSISKQALEKAMLLAYEHEHNYIGTEHLLYGVVHIDDADITTLLSLHELSLEQVIKEITIILDSTNKFPNMDDMTDTIEEMQAMIDEEVSKTMPDEPKQKKGKKKKNQAIDIYTVELTDKARQKKIDPVIGRSREVERMIHILSRRTKNNPVLVGEPGVGKTAIVEGLAKRIAEKDVPDVLRGKRIYALDLPLLVSGTIYRGEFESRIKQIIDSFAGNDQAILFIDEMHTLIGAGANQGTMDAANILKPALARGELHCIGATTLDEYQKYITPDPALARRFQSITVQEPSAAEAVEILSGIATYYEQFHRVTIDPSAIEAAVALSTKYIHDNFLPDKAIDLLDEAAAAVKVKRAATDAERAYQDIEETLGKLAQEKEEAISEERYDDAMRLKEELEAALNTREHLKVAAETEATSAARLHVTNEHVARVLGARIGESAERLLEDEWTKLSTVSDTLRSDIVGQDTVIDTIIESLKKRLPQFARINSSYCIIFVYWPKRNRKNSTVKINSPSPLQQRRRPHSTRHD